jgi:hypothetical protein
MAVDNNSDRVRELIRLQGLPPAPASSPMLAEVRTDGVVPLAPPVSAPTFSVGKLIVEWSYHVPLREVDKFNEFLKHNESFIAACCRKLMKGVSYRGTYKTPVEGAVLYKSLWSYDSPAAVEQWTNILTSKSQFVTTFERLRSYWTKDTNRTESRYDQAS